MLKILFLIHDLGQGGAEKVLVNLVNNMDPKQFDITVIALFGGGVNERYLKPSIRFRTVFPRPFPGNSHVMKLLPPATLHKLFIKERYDVEVAYLEGPSARIISGCPDPGTRLVAWIHGVQFTKKDAAGSFRNYREAVACYDSFHRIICVSETVKSHFQSLIPVHAAVNVLYNTVESKKIATEAGEEIEAGLFDANELNLMAVGTMKAVKGFDRLIRIVGRLREENLPVHLYLLGDGPDLEELKKQATDNGLQNAVTFLGYQTNPYKYVSRSDLFICSSYSEGFSTAATEALIVGTPVCTTDVSGMREMLGDSEYGVITKNSEEALFLGIRDLLEDPMRLAHYKMKAQERGKSFSTENTVRAVEEMLFELVSRP